MCVCVWGGGGGSVCVWGKLFTYHTKISLENDSYLLTTNPHSSQYLHMWTYLINCFSRFSHTSGIFSPMYFWVKVTATRSSLSLARPCLRDCENKAWLPPLPARHQSGAFCTLTKQHTHTHTHTHFILITTHTHTPFIPITIKTHPTYSLPSHFFFFFCRFILIIINNSYKALFFNQS